MDQITEVARGKTFFQKIKKIINPPFSPSKRRFLQDAATAATIIGLTFKPKPSDAISQPALAPAEKPVENTPEELPETFEERIFQNYSPEEKAYLEKEIEVYMNDYKVRDSKRADRILLNWESTIDGILKIDVPFKEHPFWKKLLSAVLFVEGGSRQTFKRRKVKQLDQTKA